MPVPPQRHADMTPAAWGMAGAAVIATLKYARDMFRSHKPESPALATSMAQIAMAVVDLRNEIKTLREVVIQSHHNRILAMELEREEILRRLGELETRSTHRRL